MNPHEMPSSDFGKEPNPKNQLSGSYSDQRKDEMMARLMRPHYEQNRVADERLAVRIKSIDTKKVEINASLREFFNYCREASNRLKNSIDAISANPRFALLDSSDVAYLSSLKQNLQTLEDKCDHVEAGMIEGERAWVNLKEMMNISGQSIAEIAKQNVFQGSLLNVENSVQKQIVENPQDLGRSRKAVTNLFQLADTELPRITNMLEVGNN